MTGRGGNLLNELADFFLRRRNIGVKMRSLNVTGAGTTAIVNAPVGEVVELLGVHMSGQNTAAAVKSVHLLLTNHDGSARTLGRMIMAASGGITTYSWTFDTCPVVTDDGGQIDAVADTAFAGTVHITILYRQLKT